MKKFHLWKYKKDLKNYQGYHLHCDASQVLEILTFIKSEYKFKKAIKFVLTKPPIDLHNFKPIKYFSLFEIIISQNSKTKWSIKENMDTVTLTFNDTDSEQILKYFAEYINGLNDFSFGEEPELWVW